MVSWLLMQGGLSFPLDDSHTGCACPASIGHATVNCVGVWGVAVAMKPLEISKGLLLTGGASAELGATLTATGAASKPSAIAARTISFFIIGPKPPRN